MRRGGSGSSPKALPGLAAQQQQQEKQRRSGFLGPPPLSPSVRSNTARMPRPGHRAKRRSRAWRALQHAPRGPSGVVMRRRMLRWP